MVDKVHTHVCGRSNYQDIKLLLERKSMWNSDVKKYLATMLESCASCIAVKQPKSERSVSLSAMPRDFNQVVCIDHLFLDMFIVFHIMDSGSRYSVGTTVADTKMATALLAFEAHWITAFWCPETILYDPAFHNSEFEDYVKALDIPIFPLPSRRHNINVLESKHRIIRDVYLRLKHANGSKPHPVLVVEAIRISNDLYGNDVMSAHELAKRYTRPLSADQLLFQIPEEIVSANEKLLAKRKLTLSFAPSL